MRLLLIIFAILFCFSCNRGKTEFELNRKLIDNNFTIYWYASEYAKNGIAHDSSFNWDKFNADLKYIKVAGASGNRDINEFIITKRDDFIYYLETTYSIQEILLKYNNTLYIYGPESGNIDTDSRIDFKHEEFLCQSVVKALSFESQYINRISFKQNLMDSAIVGNNDAFIVTNPNKDSLEFVYTFKNRRKVAIWNYERNGYMRRGLVLHDSICLSR